MNENSFESWFSQVTGHPVARAWQVDLSAEVICRNRLIRIPTGQGKTAGVLAAWSYHRVCRQDDNWPRRLVWCLPMRALVEQTEQVARQLAERMPERDRPSVHVAMGGEDGGEWHLYPERPSIIIGTQDMLLSRALNRGYASARARWPMEFGLLNQDALWVIDEAQLMDVGLATTAQLQAFRDQDRTRHLRPCCTWWMSATLQADWLKSVDTIDYHPEWIQRPATVPSEQRSGSLWEVSKLTETSAIPAASKNEFAARVLDEHRQLSPGAFGKITLVICNTVERSCATFDTLKASADEFEVELVHSRFRPAERQRWGDRFLGRRACSPDADRIIVATQVVEAGVDISAGCLITELAPWSSLVQRFGRCARFGGAGKVVVIDRGRDEKHAAPYSPKELDGAWEAIQQCGDVGNKSLAVYEESLAEEVLRRLYPYAPAQLLLRKEFDELFDTSPDLTGADVDVSRFIRSGDERDVHVFWTNLDKHEAPAPSRQPIREELCAVPFVQARNWLCGEETKSNKKSKLRGGMRAWVWDWLDGQWTAATRTSLYAGRIVCVASDCGGYCADRGFTPDSIDPVGEVEHSDVAPEVQAFHDADQQHDSEQLSFSNWKTISCHASEVASQVGNIGSLIGLSLRLRELLELSAFWHDWGKAHPAFQGSLRGATRPNRIDLAKGPSDAWRKGPHRYEYLDGSQTRPAFRHELASALGLFAVLETFEPRHEALLGPWVTVMDLLGHSLSESHDERSPTPLIRRLLKCNGDEFNLVAYLIASHHGKVRLGMQAAPLDQEYRPNDDLGLPIRGVREGDRLPPVELVPGEPSVPSVSLTLTPATLGLSRRTGVSWRERCLRLQEKYGPSALAFLESILRAADVRASRLTSPDPALMTGETT